MYLSRFFVVLDQIKQLNEIMIVIKYELYIFDYIKKQWLWDDSTVLLRYFQNNKEDKLEV